MSIRIWGQLKGCELKLVQKVKNIWSDREPKPRLKVLGANGYEADWGIGRMGVLGRNINSVFPRETELQSASPYLVELGFGGKFLKNLSSLAPFSDFPSSQACSLDILFLYHKTIFRV